MKSAFGFALLSVSLVALTGCASMERRAEAAPQAREMTAEELYMARVEQIARRRGVLVKWINRPGIANGSPVVAQE